MKNVSTIILNVESWRWFLMWIMCKTHWRSRRQRNRRNRLIIWFNMWFIYRSSLIIRMYYIYWWLIWINIWMDLIWLSRWLSLYFIIIMRLSNSRHKWWMWWMLNRFLNTWRYMELWTNIRFIWISSWCNLLYVPRRFFIKIRLWYIY